MIRRCGDAVASLKLECDDAYRAAQRDTWRAMPKIALVNSPGIRRCMRTGGPSFLIKRQAHLYKESKGPILTMNTTQARFNQVFGRVNGSATYNFLFEVH